MRDSFRSKDIDTEMFIQDAINVNNHLLLVANAQSDITTLIPNTSDNTNDRTAVITGSFVGYAWKYGIMRKYLYIPL